MRHRQETESYYREIAPFISAELAHRGDEPFWEQLAVEHEGDVLELGSGSGRVTAILARGARRVVGIDISSDMLTRGAKKAPHHKIFLVRGDMCELPFRGSFSLVVAPDDPFSHLVEDADRQAALDSAAQRLAPHGAFVIEALWFSAERQAESVKPGGRQESHEESVDGRILSVRERWRCDEQTHRCYAEYSYRLDNRPVGGAGFNARAWTPAELTARLHDSGLVITDWWGGYDREPWDEIQSRHLIIRARKR